MSTGQLSTFAGIDRAAIEGFCARDYRQLPGRSTNRSTTARSIEKSIDNCPVG
jgi:hypothetical protein